MGSGVAQDAQGLEQLEVGGQPEFWWGERGPGLVGPGCLVQSVRGGETMIRPERGIG